MYIYKRRRVYWVTYMVDGVRHQVSTHATKLADAKFFANSIDASKRAPTLEDAIAILKTIWRERPREQLLLGEAWDTYERLARTIGKLSVTDKTLKDRRNHFEAFVRWTRECAATIKTVEQVTGQVAILYAQHLASIGIKTKTRKNTITDLSTMWKVLEKASSAIVNPWANLTPQDTDGARGLPFTREQEAAVMAAAGRIGKDWAPICLIARHTGLRYGDIAMMKWDSISTVRGGTVATVRPSKTAKHGVEVVLPLVTEVAAAIRALPRRGDYLFPLHAEMYDQNGGKDIMRFREVLDAAEVKGEGYSFHSWRHTFRTRLAESGADIEVAMRLCGHTQKATSRRYDHAEHLDEMKAAIEAAR